MGPATSASHKRQVGASVWAFPSLPRAGARGPWELGRSVVCPPGGVWDGDKYCFVFLMMAEASVTKRAFCLCLTSQGRAVRLERSSQDGPDRSARAAVRAVGGEGDRCLSRSR